MEPNQEPQRISGTDSTETYYSLASFPNGILILTLLDRGKAVTLVLSGEKASEFVQVANYSQGEK